MRPALLAKAIRAGKHVYCEKPIQRPSWNYRKEDSGGMILDMMCHWSYLLDNLFDEVKSVSCLGVTHIHKRWDEADQPYDCTADAPAYATCELTGHNGEPVVAQFNMSWATRVRRDDLVTFHVDGTDGSAVAGLSSCRAQSRVATPRPVWNPDEKQTMNFLDQWQDIPDTQVYDDGFKNSVGAFHSPRGRGRALPLDAARGCQGRATGRGRARKLERAALGGCAGATVLIAYCASPMRAAGLFCS